jgi:hypothetical protein
MFKPVFISFLLFVLVFSSCNYFKKPKEPNAIARVGNVFLYDSDITTLVPPGTSKNDSIAIVKDYINRWATQKLLFTNAEVNLNKTDADVFEKLINQYKIDLYTNAYIEDLIVRQIDTVVTNQEIESYYNVNKAFFKNPNELVKLRYINLVKKNPKLASFKSKFSSFTKNDRMALQQDAVSFKSYAFNDSVWVDANQIFEKLPFINLENKDKYLSTGMSYEYVDSTSVWLVKVREVLPRNSSSPLQFIRPTIRQVIINKRKLELLKKIESDITNDAIKSKEYEIYE